jgi:hypothetical protein
MSFRKYADYDPAGFCAIRDAKACGIMKAQCPKPAAGRVTSAEPATGRESHADGLVLARAAASVESRTWQLLT